MNVQELIDELAKFRAEAEVIFWMHNEKEGIEYAMPILHVCRDNLGAIGLNWNEDASVCLVKEIKMTNK